MTWREDYPSEAQVGGNPLRFAAIALKWTCGTSFLAPPGHGFAYRQVKEVEDISASFILPQSREISPFWYHDALLLHFEFSSFRNVRAPRMDGWMIERQSRSAWAIMGIGGDRVFASMRVKAEPLTMPPPTFDSIEAMRSPP